MRLEKRNELHNDQFSLIPLTEKDVFRSWEILCFNCGNDDLNEFFQIDSYAHFKELLATTYYFQPIEATEKNMFLPVALISLLNDRIEITKEERKGEKKGFGKDLQKSIPYPKRNYSSFPAVKIGRLGVSIKYQRNDIGTCLLNMIKDLFLKNNRTGCRYITVDAYNTEKTINFYLKNNFLPLWDEDIDDPYSRILYFDLKRHQVHSSSPDISPKATSSPGA